MEETIARVLQVLLAMAGAYALALWFALAVWTYRDITARSSNAFAQIFSTLMVVLFWVPGAFIYLILRPRETLDEAFQRSVEEEYLLHDLADISVCPTCQSAVRDDFLYCPSCSVELRHPCPICDKVVDLRWLNCAYCGSDLGTAPAVKSKRAVVSASTSAPAPAKSRNGAVASVNGKRTAARPAVAVVRDSEAAQTMDDSDAGSFASTAETSAGVDVGNGPVSHDDATVRTPVTRPAPPVPIRDRVARDQG